MRGGARTRCGRGDGCVERRGGWPARRRARACAPCEGPDHAFARPRRSRPVGGGGALRGRLSRPARRWALRTRGHDGGARLRARRDGGRGVRAVARRSRAGAGRQRAAHRGAGRRLPPEHARQRAGDRPGRARGLDMGDGSPPQRHPARAADRGAGDGVARRADAAGGYALDEAAAICDPGRFASCATAVQNDAISLS